MLVAPSLLAVLVVAAGAVVLHPVQRTIDSGTIEGVTDGKWVRFLGVPYAEPPVGSNRWQPPRPVTPWQGVRKTNRWGPDCPQVPDGSSFFRKYQSEDCLHLSLWAPANATRASVLVFIHGGSFTGGSAAGNDWPDSPLYNGTKQAAEGSILVTFNYRVGPLGFLGGSTVAAKTSDGSSGNFGIQDQRAVLEWVQCNIEVFGGDKTRVAIFGESAGASCVGVHMVSPKAEGLFYAAALESGSYDNATVQPDPDAEYHSFARKAGCKGRGTDQHSCLMNKTVDQLWRALVATDNNGVWGPVVDGVELINTPERLAEGGHFIQSLRTVVVGSNENEGRLLVPQQAPVPRGIRANQVDVRKWLRTSGYFPPEKADDILSRYPCRKGPSGCWKAAASIWTDSQFVCPARNTAIKLTGMGRKVFVYALAYSPSLYTSFLAWTNGVPPSLAGVPHGAELPLVFDDDMWLSSDAGRRLARVMLNYWHFLADSADPNGKGAVTWPVFTLEGEETLVIRPNSTVAPKYHTALCRFWSSMILPIPT